MPDHPLVQPDHRRLPERSDGHRRAWSGCSRGIETGAIGVVARDLTEPSPLALEVLSARPYAYLDDAPLEERRTQAVMGRRWLDAGAASDIGRLDADAIDRVRHRSLAGCRRMPMSCTMRLVWLGFLTEARRRRRGWSEWLVAAAARKACRAAGCASRPGCGSPQNACPIPGPVAARDARAHDRCAGRPRGAAWSREERPGRDRARQAGGAGAGNRRRAWQRRSEFRRRNRRSARGARDRRFRHARAFHAGAPAEEWCERRLLARIHRYTVKRLRGRNRAGRGARLHALSVRLAARRRGGPHGRAQRARRGRGSARRLRGAGRRMGNGDPAGPPGQLRSGVARRSMSRRAHRLGAAATAQRTANGSERRPAPVRSTPIALLPRRHVPLWAPLRDAGGADAADRRAAQAVADYLGEHGASFFDELVDGTRSAGAPRSKRRWPSWWRLGLVSSDSFGGLRALLVPVEPAQAGVRARRGRRRSAFGMESAGRWALARRTGTSNRRRRRRSST